MDKPILIKSNEILLIVCDSDEHITQSGPLDEKQILDIVDNCFDEPMEIFRVNTSEKSCESISEEIAEAYVTENIDRLDEDSKVYYFVSESDAYHAFLDEIAQLKYEDEMFGSYEKQHRLRLCDVL
ncbi:hypothetical protein [Bartonella sp. AA1HLJMS]|uniref:hypothetical protein n=1 Tax=Bartonella sp. AA1HLJMS TaxID=3243424 RepID=UPI0035CF8514